MGGLEVNSFSVPCVAAAALWQSQAGHLWVWQRTADSLCVGATAETPPTLHGNPPPDTETMQGKDNELIDPTPLLQY